MEDLKIDVADRGKWSVITVAGEVDLSSSPALREEFLRLVGLGRYQVIVDLSGVEFLDSTGLGVLVAGLKRLRDNGGDLVLAGPEPRILRLFEITGLTKVFVIHASVEEAVGA